MGAIRGELLDDFVQPIGGDQLLQPPAFLHAFSRVAY
jgi:hypothetical protein